MDSNTIDISGLSKAAVLAALYNRATPLGLGWLHYDPQPMTEQEASELLGSTENDMGFPKRAAYFDYLKGRVMKVDLSGESFSPALYDRDNGSGAAAAVIAELRAEVALAA